jgi:transcriptional regulator with XRE-family HTH domain
MDHEPPQGDAGAPPVIPLTADQVVAFNLRYWRREAGLTQEAAGALLGWSADNLGQYEKSWEPGRPRRRFDAQALAEIALALGIPLAALFLPPPGEHDGGQYRLRLAAAGRHYDMGDMMALLVMPDNDDDTPVMDAYRARFNEAAARYLNPQWAATAARLLKGSRSPQAAADLAAQMRDDRAGLLRVAERLGELAGAMEAPGGGQ